MKKSLIALVIVVVVLALSPLVIGKMAERRIDAGLDKLLVEAPFITISERKYHSGWFSSELDVTFELFSAMAPARGEPAPKFTLHSDIRHGPIIGSSIGMARTKTWFVVKDPKVREELRKVFGDDNPIDITTDIGFGGGSTTVISSAARDFSADGDKFSWDALKLVMVSSGNGDSFTVDGGWPRFEGTSRDGKKVVLRGLRAKGGGKRIVGDLYDGGMEFAIDEMQVDEPDQSTQVDKLLYVATVEPKGEYVDMAFKLGCGAIKGKNASFKEAHYDLTLRRLHAATWDKFMAKMKTAMTNGMAGKTNSDKEVEEAVKKDLLELLKHDPEIGIDRISVATDEGDGGIKGIIRLKGVTADDLESPMGLLTKIVADLDFDFSEAMLTKLAGNAESADGMVKSGFAERKDGRLLSKISYNQGKLLVNGKEQALPGMGGPPPGGAAGMQ